MNVLQEGARGASYGWLVGVVTIVFIIAFVAWIWWLFARKNRKRFDEAAELPFEAPEAKPRMHPFNGRTGERENGGT